MKKGDKVKVTYKFGVKTKLMKTGIIAALTNNLICIKFRNYIESFKITDMFCEDEWVEIQLRQDNKWITINKSNVDDIRHNKLLKHILRTRFLDLGDEIS